MCLISAHTLPQVVGGRDHTDFIISVANSALILEILPLMLFYVALLLALYCKKSLGAKGEELSVLSLPLPASISLSGDHLLCASSSSAQLHSLDSKAAFIARCFEFVGPVATEGVPARSFDIEEAVDIAIENQTFTMLFPWEEESDDPLDQFRTFSMVDRSPAPSLPSMLRVSSVLMNNSLKHFIADTLSGPAEEEDVDYVEMQPVTKKKRTMRRREDADVKKCKLIKAWTRIVLLDANCSQVGLQLFGKSDEEQQFIMDLVLQQKAANTLATRLSPISAYLLWARGKDSGWPPSEES